MDHDGLARETNIAVLRTRALELAARNEVLEHENATLLKRIVELTRELAKSTDRPTQLALQFEIQRINETLAARNQELFGSSRSERRHTRQEPKPEPKKHPGHGPTPQPRLPLTPELHLLDEADCTCPGCGGTLTPMENQTEDAEQISIIERKITRTLHRRQKYHCGTCGDLDTALGPAPLIPGGRYTADLAIAVAVDKYADHLPLERQVDRFDRLGFQVTSQTLWDQLVALYVLLLPTYLAHWDDLLTESLLGADESPWRLMGKGPQAGRSAKWWVWVLVGAAGVFYLLSATRGADGARALLKGFSGILTADGYAVYASLQEAGRQTPLPSPEGVPPPPVPAFLLVACWMHARRRFVACEKNNPPVTRGLDLMGQLYAIEAKAEAEAGDDPARLLERRRVLRDTESRAVIALLDAWRKAQRPLPGLAFDEALRYLDGQWPRLLHFLENPAIPLDNGASERAMRGPVLGRKNHYGSHSELGTRVAALFYTLIESCKLLDLDPTAYLREATRRAQATKGAVLLPRVWKAEFAATKAAAATATAGPAR